MFILIQSLDPVETDCRQFLIGEAAIFYCILDIRNLFSITSFPFSGQYSQYPDRKAGCQYSISVLHYVSQPFFPRRGSHFIIKEATGCYTQQEDKGSNNNLLFFGHFVFLQLIVIILYIWNAILIKKKNPLYRRVCAFVWNYTTGSVYLILSELFHGKSSPNTCFASSFL